MTDIFLDETKSARIRHGSVGLGPDKNTMISGWVGFDLIGLGQYWIEPIAPNPHDLSALYRCICNCSLPKVQQFMQVGETTRETNIYMTLTCDNILN